MKTHQNLTLIGTSHIAQQSIDEITRAVEQIKPDIIALELDKGRFAALIDNKKQKVGLSEISRIGIKGYLFSLIGAYLQKKLGKIVNVQPGADMLTAINLAKKYNIQLALIDRPIEITLKRFSREFTWKEKFRVLADILKGIFFPKRQLKKYGLGQFDLSKVPKENLIRKLIKGLKERYPSLYKVLIEERNQVLAKNLGRLMGQAPEKKILAVVGAGHGEEIMKLVKR